MSTTFTAVWTALRAALNTTLGTLAGTPPIQWPFQPFSKPDNSAWVKVKYAPGEPYVYSMGANGRDKLEGFVQVSLYYPVASGNAAALTASDLVRSAFYAGARFTTTGQAVSILSTGVDFAEDATWSIAYVTINWEAETTRQ
jgi:hypothetical protein